MPSEVSEIHIREMILADLQSVFTLGEELFTASKWPSLYRTWDEYELVGLFESDGDFCYVAEDQDGNIVSFALGSLIVKHKSAWNYGHIVWLGVDPTLKRKGVGSKLIKKLTKLFMDHGARMIIVDTDAENEEAIRFFRKNGFANENPHIYLTKNLSKKRVKKHGK